MATVAERVQNGIDLLDAQGPRDWREKIDLDAFDIRSCTRCVLGQVMEIYPRRGTRYRDGFQCGQYELLNGSTDMAEEYGFDACVGPRRAGDQARLNKEWVRRLRQKR